MLIGGVGLSEVQTSDLKTLLKYLHRGDLRCPIDVAELARCGLQHTAEPLLRQLHGLDKTAVLAVVVAVLSERMASERATRARIDADLNQARWDAADAAADAGSEE